MGGILLGWYKESMLEDRQVFANIQNEPLDRMEVKGHYRFQMNINNIKIAVVNDKKNRSFTYEDDFRMVIIKNQNDSNESDIARIRPI